MARDFVPWRRKISGCPDIVRGCIFITGVVSRMRQFSRAVMLLVCFAGVGLWAQAQAPQDVTGTGASAAPAGTSASAVITLNGLCTNEILSRAPGAPPSSGTKVVPASDITPTPDCKTEISKDAFEAQFKALKPKGTEVDRRRMAQQYPEMLVFAERAHELGLDNNPDFQQRTRMNYLQNLGQTMVMHIKEQVLAIPDAELAKFYKEHPDRFVKFHLARVIVPKTKEHGDKAVSAEVQVADAQQMKVVADKIYKEAQTGVPFSRLQARAYAAAGYPEDAIEVDAGDEWTIDHFSKEYAQAFLDLKPGQVSPVIDYVDSYQFFKLIARTTVPESEAKGFEQQMLIKDVTDKMRDAVNIKTDEAYFSGPAASSDKAPEAVKNH